MDKALSIERPDDYVPPKDGDPANRVEFDDNANIIMLDGKPLIYDVWRLLDLGQANEQRMERN